MAYSATSIRPKKKWFADLYNEINEDNIYNGAATLAYYWLFALFPAMIFLLSLIPYLPIANLHAAVMDFISQTLPAEAARQFEGVIAEVTMNRRGGLLSFGIILTLWAASSGLYAIMQELNTTYDVRESRPFWKARLTAILLTLMFVVGVIGSFALIVFGGVLQDWMQKNLGLDQAVLVFFSIFRWVVIAMLLLAGFSLIYYFGPDVEQEFRFVTPGSVFGVFILALASLLFRFYIENFGDYAATYGSLGAVMILMLWLYITGFVLLMGSEVNALAEHYSVEGKRNGQKSGQKLIRPRNAVGRKDWRWPPKSLDQGMVVASHRQDAGPVNENMGLDLALAGLALIFAIRK